mgnify:CR=1 FL=1
MSSSNQQRLISLDALRGFDMCWILGLAGVVESLLKQVDAGQSGPREQVKFIKGDNVRIVDGPFLGFNGLVDEVDQDHSRLKLMVSIFGRSTPVELGFLQVERI